MNEETPFETEKKEDIIDLAMKKTRLPEEDMAHDEDENNNTVISEELIDDDSDAADRRKYPRSEFTYPVEFKIFSQNSEYASFQGYLKDISMSGACLQYEDKYGRFDIKGMNNMKLKISFSVPNGDRANLFALIRWIRRAAPKSFSFKMGIEFIDMESWQLDVIEKLTGMRNKDHNMMWNLWEQYETNWK